MSKTYIHHQGFVYGPVAEPKPVFDYDFPPDGPSESMYNSAVDDFDDRNKRWCEAIISLPKYKWTGPELPDWSEVVEGEDFSFECEHCIAGESFINHNVSNVAVPILKQDIYSKLEALKKENESLKERINQLNKIINHEMGKSK